MLFKTSKIIHLWTPHPPLTDVPAVAFPVLPFASAALCGPFLNYIFQFVYLSTPCTAVSQGAIGTQKNDIEFHSARST